MFDYTFKGADIDERFDGDNYSSSCAICGRKITYKLFLCSKHYKEYRDSQEQPWLQFLIENEKERRKRNQDTDRLEVLSLESEKAESLSTEDYCYFEQESKTPEEEYLDKEELVEQLSNNSKLVTYLSQELKPRQLEILHLLSEGCSDTAIAEKLNISRMTVWRLKQELREKAENVTLS